MNTTDLILKMTEGRPIMYPEEMAKLFGITVESLRNKLYAKRLPVPTFKVGGKTCAHVTDVAAYIDHQRDEAATESLRDKRQAA
jgi:hypothetical protein